MVPLACRQILLGAADAGNIRDLRNAVQLDQMSFVPLSAYY